MNSPDTRTSSQPDTRPAVCVQVDADDRLLANARGDREAAWGRVLIAAAEYDAAWSIENEIREDVHRRRLERLRFLHSLNEDAA